MGLRSKLDHEYPWNITEEMLLRNVDENQHNLMLKKELVKEAVSVHAKANVGSIGDFMITRRSTFIRIRIE
ncbi:hypothetical protein CDL15_Pgr028181 [Punica granatum]|uniref:Uncharacterized protein n=1 Tax=Punica granatum TaxID=22663 RepID=A0A218XHN3_PUNGR|nr:hypothetical protein CDL15_Pgr028181 [Punica granatum]